MIDHLGPQHPATCRDRIWSRGLEGIYGRPGSSIRDRLARPACVGAGSLACRPGGARMAWPSGPGSTLAKPADPLDVLREGRV